MERELTLEEKEQKVKDLRPIDDVFFEVRADDIGFCQEMLRIILGMINLWSLMSLSRAVNATYTEDPSGWTYCVPLETAKNARNLWNVFWKKRSTIQSFRS